MSENFTIYKNIPVFHKTETISTMLDAATRLRLGDEPPFVCTADHQKGGKGRRPGRPWVDSGRSLLFTAVFAQKDVLVDLPLFPIAVASSLAKVLSNYGIDGLNISWPNDILINEKKVSGILCERKGDYVFAGVGINLESTEYNIELRKPASSVFEETGIFLKKNELLDSLVREMSNISILDAIEIINKFLYKKNQKVKVLVGDPSAKNYIEAVLLRVLSNGTLLVEHDGKSSELAVGEIIFN